MVDDQIASRAVGQYPISIATSLALEAAFGIYPERPVGKPPILEYQALWINLRTLYRNLMGSLPKVAVEGGVPREFADALNFEMETIRNIIATDTNNRVKVVFYVSNYKDLERHYPHALLRTDTTEKQKAATEVENQTLVMLVNEMHAPVMVFDRAITTGEVGKTAIITHYAYDLLSYRAFGSLTLLESHTGVFKERAQWYTKFANGKELSMIPFREDMLQIFGDNELFKPMSIKARHAVIELAQQYRWTAVTTTDRIRENMKKISDPLIQEMVRRITG